jgi:hypothetical protein
VPKITRLTVIADGYRQKLHAAPAEHRSPAVERLIARGTRHARNPHEPVFASIEPWQRRLMDVLGLAPDFYPSAAVSAMGAGLDAFAGHWLHADFAHLAAGLDHLILVPLIGEQQLDASARDGLRAAVASHVSAEGYTWRTAGLSEFLYTVHPLVCDLCAPGVASRLPLVEAMPRGIDGGRLRRLMTELQMQLHEHPVNEARARQGLLAANAVWLWGAGEMPHASSTIRLPVAFSDEPYVRGVYRVHQQDSHELPATLQGILAQVAQAEHVLVVMNDGTAADLESNWFAPIERALSGRLIERAELWFDDLHVSADRWSGLRRWRRIEPVKSLFA